MTTAPPLTRDQCLDALREGNRIRTVRADLKREVRAMGSTRAAARVRELIEAPPDDLLTMRVEELMRAVPKLGEGKVGKLLRRVGVSPSKTLGGLTERQREALRVELEAIGRQYRPRLLP
jgi:predicted DNA binding protein